MSTPTARRVWLSLALQLAVLATAMAATYDRGPIPAATAWLVGRDREREAATRAVAQADEAAQRTPANAVRGADGETRYALVRTGRPLEEPPRVQRSRRGTRITYGILLAISLWTAAGRLRRIRREAREAIAFPPHDALPQPWPDTPAGVPVPTPAERSPRAHARVERPPS